MKINEWMITYETYSSKCWNDRSKWTDLAILQYL